ncbi:hypothetical protein [Stieleria marina]|uniref:Uncharacterized protein n=1 Tax=Stieleria marina TaxID=1930275 RepID=A0A517NXI1_9BACT|nr:hypothetical protein K239x_38340 [Planctomycetes bacterium K23_9]
MMNNEAAFAALWMIFAKKPQIQHNPTFLLTANQSVMGVFY